MNSCSEQEFKYDPHIYIKQELYMKLALAKKEKGDIQMQTLSEF
jgi:hypothetical protein